MELSTISSASTALQQARTGDAVNTLVFKKALDLQGQGAMQLIAALPTPPSNPAHLGNSVDVKA